MLNPKLYEVYDESVVNCFKVLAERAQSDNEHIALLGVNTRYGVKAPNVVLLEHSSYLADAEVFEICKKYSSADKSIIRWLHSVSDEKLWHEKTANLVELWVK